MRYRVSAPWGIEVQLDAPGDMDLLHGVRPDAKQAAMDALLMDIACSLADERAYPMAGTAAPEWECVAPCLDNIETI